MPTFLKRKRFKKSLSLEKALTIKKNGAVTEKSNLNYSIKYLTTYSIDGKGIIHPKKGVFYFNGSQMTSSFSFNYSSNYPILKTENPLDNICEIEFGASKGYNFIYDQNTLSHITKIPEKLSSFDFSKYTIFLISGKKNSGKTTFTPYIINRLFSLKKNVYFLECDLFHPYIPFLYAISLFKINIPIFTNNPVLLDEKAYTRVHSFYIVDQNEIEDVYSIIKKCYEFFPKGNDNVLVINSFSCSEQTSSVYNCLIYRELIEHDNYACTLYFSNKCLKEKEKNDNSVEDYIFYGENINSLAEGISGLKRNKGTKSYNVKIENNYIYEQDKSNQLEIFNKKKQQEIDSIMYHFDNKEKCSIKQINLEKIHFIYESVFIDFKGLTMDAILKVFFNKYCALFTHTDKNVKLPNILDYCVFKDLYLLSIGKIVNIKDNIISFLTDAKISNDDEEYYFYMDFRIEKLIKEVKKDVFMKYMSNLSFSYDITNNDQEHKDNTVLYLSRNSYNLL